MRAVHSTRAIYDCVYAHSCMVLLLIESQLQVPVRWVNWLEWAAGIDATVTLVLFSRHLQALCDEKGFDRACGAETTGAEKDEKR